MMLRKLSLQLTTALIFTAGLACAPTVPRLVIGKHKPVRPSAHDATSSKYMVVTQGDAATRAGRAMFEQGGNIFDAAVAVTFAISVERPQSTGIAGGGFMLIRHGKNGAFEAFDFREKAPKAATRTMYQDDDGNVVDGLSLNGPKAAGVPGIVAGALEVHKRYGSLPLAVVMQPAIALAEDGFTVYPHLAQAIAERTDELKKYPASVAAFFKDDGTPYQVGDHLRQPDLAKTLRAIAEHGRDGFYKGWVAEALVDHQEKLGGLIRQDDLDAYEVKLRTPVRTTFRGHTLVSMPPPSSGGTHVVQILNILEALGLDKAPYQAMTVHKTASAMQRAFADRAQYLGDTDFVEVPIAGLTSKAYAKSLAATVNPQRAAASNDVSAGEPGPYESSQTTHFTLADADGNVIASTQTVNGWMGSAVVVPGTGMILNNQMDDFSAKPGVPNQFGVIGGEENAIHPEKRPLSSMSPTIVEKNGKPVMAMGTPSGSRIISCVALTALNVLAHGMNLYDAVSALRYHHQWKPDTLFVEEPGLPSPTHKKLQEMGYSIETRGLGCKIEAIAYQSNGSIRGVADPRGEGLAAGEMPPPPPPVYTPNSAADVQRD